jgi:hypothetical protein
MAREPEHDSWKRVGSSEVNIRTCKKKESKRKRNKMQVNIEIGGKIDGGWQRW